MCTAEEAEKKIVLFFLPGVLLWVVMLWRVWCVWCLSLLSVAAGQTVTPQVWFAVTPSVQVSLRETLNPPQHCQTSGMLFCSRHTALTSRLCVTLWIHRESEIRWKNRNYWAWRRFTAVAKCIHRGFNQIYEVKGLHKIDLLVNIMHSSGFTTYCNPVSEKLCLFVCEYTCICICMFVSNLMEPE